MKCAILTLITVYVVVTPVSAQVAGQTFVVGGVISGAGQGEHLAQSGVTHDGQAMPIQPELSFRPGDANQFLVKLGFAAGNGLNGSCPFNIPPWAADLEDDVKQINGRNRDYLLAAWYKHSARNRNGTSMGITIGVIDATDYLDDNAFSNDEYSQFMNGALVNAPSAFLPSYDIGTALEVEVGHWGFRGVYMNVGENDDGNNFNFVGVQVCYRLDTPFGEGNYRVLGIATDRQFLDPTGSRLERRAGVVTSFDQQLGPRLGAYIRLATQDDRAAIDYGTIYSGGLDLNGEGWGRAGDNLGIGYARLSEGNGHIEESHVGEVYYRFALNKALALTADVQYMSDIYRADENGPQGWIMGFRMVASL